MKYFHVALSVTNIERSRKFYEDVLGLVFKKQGERPELQVKFVLLEDRNTGTNIELFEHDQPKPLHEDLMEFQQVGLKHMAFIVDNIDEAIERALINGSEIIWPPKKGITVKRIAFVSDPDGIPIELVEV